MKKTMVFLSIAIIGFTACSKSNEETLSGNSNTGGSGNSCDTVNMKFAANVFPIIQNNCFSCHGNGVANGGVSLENYNLISQRAGNGSLMGAITHASGFSPMPQGRPKLAACDINKIKSWIDRGRLNN